MSRPKSILSQDQVANILLENETQETTIDHNDNIEYIGGLPFQKKREKIYDHGSVLSLGFPHHEVKHPKSPDLHYYWISDEQDTGRLHQYTHNNDTKKEGAVWYAIVPNKQGKPITRRVGVGRDGTVLFAYLCATPKVDYDERIRIREKSAKGKMGNEFRKDLHAMKKANEKQWSTYDTGDFNIIDPQDAKRFI